MSPEGARRERVNALGHLVDRLGEHAREFTPDEAPRHASPSSLPGRRPGENLETVPQRVTGAGAIILDCGTSRLSGYSHVLLISHSAEAILGSQAFDLLPEVVGGLPGVVAYQWQGIDHLHVRAPGSDWNELLQAARGAINALF